MIEGFNIKGGGATNGASLEGVGIPVTVVDVGKLVVDMLTSSGSEIVKSNWR